MSDESGAQTDETDRNDAEWVRDAVIEDVLAGRARVSRSGAWAAERVEEPAEGVRVYRLDEVIEPGDDRYSDADT